jgi:predicted dehydrogenase
MPSFSRREFASQSLSGLTPFLAGAFLPSLMPSPTLGHAQTRIRVGQIGTKHGHASGKHEAVTKLSDHFELIGVVEEDQAQRERVQKTAVFQSCTWMTVDQLLSQPGLQLVLIETEIDQLLNMAEKCLRAGMHVHLDKPAGTSMEQFQRVAKLASDSKRIMQLGYMFRSNTAFQFLFNAVKQGWLGEVFEIHGVISKKLSNSDRADPTRYRGGSMFELGCHLIDAVVTILGKPQSISPFNTKTIPDVDQLNDNCLVVFRYPKATASIRSSMVEVDGGRRRQFVVCGTKGTIEILPLEPPQLTLTLDQAIGGFRKGTQTVELTKMTGRYDGDLLSLASAIRGESEYPYSVQHDLTVQECVLKASEMF